MTVKEQVYLPVGVDKLGDNVSPDSPRGDARLVVIGSVLCRQVTLGKHLQQFTRSRSSFTSRIDLYNYTNSLIFEYHFHSLTDRL